MDENRTIGAEFTRVQATVPANANPFALAEGILAGQVNPADARGLPERTLTQLEGRLENLIARDGQRAETTLDKVQNGTANNNTVASATAYFNSPQGQRFILDPQLKQIIIDYVGAPDKDAARPAADRALAERMQQLEGGVPGVMQTLRGEAPAADPAAEQRARPTNTISI